MKPTLLLTIGLPRSGKSSWAKTSGHPIVCPDEIRLALHGQRFVASAEPIVWAIAHVMVSALFGAGHTTVILDATNLTKKRRNEWLSPDWTLDYEVFRDSPITCIERAINSDRHDLIPVIKRMSETIEWPEDRLPD